MNSKDLKEKIKMAKEAVENESEPYKTEAFKIIFAKLLDLSPTLQNEVISNKNVDMGMDIDLDSKIAELATKCDITIDELKDVISIKNDRVEIIKPLTGSDAQKHLIVAQCVLAVYEVVFEQEWVPASILTECLKSSGVKDLANLAQTLKKYSSQLFRSEGIKRNKKYRLTSGEGRISAFKQIKELAKSEFSGRT